jgi:multidrug efflux pump subunit AcrA (membrane-fusion protein)
MTRSTSSATLAATLAFALLGAACGKTKAPPQRPAVPVAVAAVKRTAVPFTILANGIVQPIQTAQITSQVDGQIMEIAFQEGQEVEKGQVLFRIDQRQYKAAYDQAVANMAKDQAILTLDEKQVIRYETLVAKDYVTQEQADSQRTTAAAQKATLASDSGAVAAAKFNLDNATIRAPFAGKTGSLQVRAGTIVHAASATNLVLLNEVRPILVQFAVPATALPDIQKYNAGGKLPVTVYRQLAQQPGGESPTTGAATDPPPTDAAPQGGQAVTAPNSNSSTAGTPAANGPPTIAQHGAGGAGGSGHHRHGGAGAASGDPSAAGSDSTSLDQDQMNPGLAGGPPGGGVTGSDANSGPSGPGIDGTLTFINNAIDTATGTVLLKATFANTGSQLWPGEFVVTTLKLFTQQNALVVPPQAVMSGQQGTYVFVVDQTSSTVKQRPVSIDRTTSNVAVISSGLNDGETVVTDGQSRLQNGAKIRVRAVTNAAVANTASRTVQ